MRPGVFQRGLECDGFRAGTGGSTGPQNNRHTIVKHRTTIYNNSFPLMLITKLHFRKILNLEPVEVTGVLHYILF